eukprot:scaffold98991_cov48-Phaeocystis_antarctica.AAC.2
MSGRCQAPQRAALTVFPSRPTPTPPRRLRGFRSGLAGARMPLVQSGRRAPTMLRTRVGGAKTGTRSARHHLVRG